MGRQEKLRLLLPEQEPHRLAAPLTLTAEAESPVRRLNSSTRPGRCCLANER